MALTELKIKSLKPRKSRYLLADGHGLYIAVMPTGEKYWYVRSWKNGRESKVSIGKYPDISLKEARDLAHTEHTPRSKAVLFRDAANDWVQIRHAPSVRESTLSYTVRTLNSLLIPRIGHLDIKEITPQIMLSALRDIQDKSSVQNGHRLMWIASRIFRFAIAAGLCEWDPAAQIGEALIPYTEPRHMAPDDPVSSLKSILPAVKNIKNPVVRNALMFVAYTFVRISECAGAQWDEIDGDTWSIPAERMKGRRDHVVPLSRQAMQILDDMRSITVARKFVFVNNATLENIRLNALERNLKKLKPADIIFTPHSFRGCASTILNEHGFRPDIIEMQLAHAEKNSVRAAYNKAQYLDERRTMMQWYADFIDSL